MKAQMKAIAASAIVIVLALTAVSGVTYSWFSDTEETDVDITAGEIVLDITTGVEFTGYGDEGPTELSGTETQMSTGAYAHYTTKDSGNVSGTDVYIKGMAPGDKVTITYTGTSTSTIKTIHAITTDLSGPFTVDENVTVTDSEGGDVVEGTAIDANETVGIRGTVVITMPTTVGSEYMGETFVLSVVIGFYQANIGADNLPNDSVESVIINGFTDVVVSNDETTVEIKGLNSGTASATAKVSVLGGFADNGFILAEEGDFIAGVSVEFSDGASQQGEAEVKMIVSGDYTNGSDGLGNGLVIRHVDGAVSTDITPSSVSCSDGKTTIVFEADSFSEYYLMDAGCIRIGDEMYTLQGAFDAAVGEGSEDDPVEMILERDVRGGGAVLKGESHISLDLRGHTYVFINHSVGSSGTTTSGLQLLKGSTVTITNGTFVTNSDGETGVFKILIQNYSDLTLDSVTVDGRGLFGDGINYVVSNNCGDSAFTGSTIIYADSGDFAFDVYDYTSSGYSLPTVTVDSGVIINGAVAAAARIGDVHYATLQQAIDVAGAGDIIDLLGDTIFTSTGSVSGDTVTTCSFSKNRVTIDGNGNVLEVVADIGGKKNGGFLTVASGTVFNDVIFEAEDGNLFHILEDIDVTFSGCTFKGDLEYVQGANFIQCQGPYTGKLVIEDCTFVQSGDNVNRSVRVVAGDGASITVTGCEFTGGNGVDASTPVKVSGDLSDVVILDNTKDSTDVWAYKNDEGDASYIVLDTSCTAVARIGGVGYTELQVAIESAVDGDEICLLSDFEGDVTVEQKPGVEVIINGNSKTFAGVIMVDGKSATYQTAGLIIKNVEFKAGSISADACINFGKDGGNNTRYVCNVTVENCTFDVPNAVGVKSYTGGDKNLKITGCVVTSVCHSLLQVDNINGILIKNCSIYSVRGLNFNHSNSITVEGCTVDVQKYAVRFGEDSGGDDTSESYMIKDCTLKSANADGDAAIVLRATAGDSTLTITNTTITANETIDNKHGAIINNDQTDQDAS